MWTDYLPQIVTFGLFLLGLLAWQKQLTDKRRFEVAEQVLVTFNRVAHAIQQVRTRHRWWLLLKTPSATLSRFEQERIRRRARYSIPDERMKALETELATLRPTYVLARMYLRPGIAEKLLVLERVVDEVKDAAERLPALDPRTELEPKVEIEDWEPLGEPDYYEEEEFNEEQQKQVGASLMSIRFEQRDAASGRAKSGDEQLQRIDVARDALEVDCVPYQTSPSLLAFIGRFLMALVGLERR
jgi:hypothetical protein